MSKYPYRSLGTALDRKYRNDLNANFQDVESDLKELKGEFGNAVEIVSNEAFSKVVDSAKIDWLSPVNTFADLTTTYPNVIEGKTAMTRDNGKVYRFNGTEWIEIQEIDPTAINEVDTRLSSQLAQTETKVSKIININEYRNLVPNNTILPRSEWDWTEAFKKAALDASEQGKAVELPKEDYKITDTFTNINSKRSIHWKGNYSNIIFVNTIENKALLDLTPGTSGSTFENIRFSDYNPRTSKAIRISAYPKGDGEPNWKNRFVGCEFYSFKTGVHFATDGDPTVGSKQDWASENLFLHCKFKNCELAVFNENLQALNNTFIQTDIENDEESEYFTMIRDYAGGGLNFSQCSFIGRGRVFEWKVPQGSNNLFIHSLLKMTQCRFEVRVGHIGVLFYQDPTGSYGGFVNQNIFVSECSFYTYEQTIDLIRFSGKVKAHFIDLDIQSGNLVVKNYPVEGISGTTFNGSLGEVKVTRANHVTYDVATTNEYGIYNRRFPAKVVIDNVYPQSSGSMLADSYGFYKYMFSSPQQQLSFGLSNATPNRLIWNDPQETAGFTSIKAIVPKWARLLKFGLWKEPVRFNIAIQYKLYLVKDVAKWANPGVFNATTDAFLVADTGSTANKAGLIEVPVQLTDKGTFVNSMVSGFGADWTEGRIYIEHTGSQNFGGFVFVEYM